MFGYTNFPKEFLRRSRLSLLVIFAISLLLAACTPASPASQPPAAEPENQPVLTEGATTGPQTQPERSPEPLPDPITGPIDIPETPILGEVPPDLLEQIFADLEQNQGRNPAEAVLLRAQSITWSDGSLGCPEPGQMYTQALVDGYWIQIQSADDVYDYRATRQGTFKLCSSGLSLPEGIGPTE